MDDRAARRLSVLAGHLNPSNTGRVTPVLASGQTTVSKRIELSAPKNLVEQSVEGFKRAMTDGRVSDRPSSPMSWKGQVPLTSYRFSQSSVSSGFSHPSVDSVNVPLAVSLRSANPMSVLTEGPGSGEGAPPVNATPNLDGQSLTTFDHRRVVNTALHAPDQQMKTHMVDRSSVPAKEWRKYTTQTRGERISVLDVNKQSLGNLSLTKGPDAKLAKNTLKALGHMVNRSAMHAELTQRRASPGQIADNDRATSRVHEYTERLESFHVRSLPKSKL